MSWICFKIIPGGVGIMDKTKLIKLITAEAMFWVMWVYYSSLPTFKFSKIKCLK